MKHPFTLPEYPDSKFEIEVAHISGKIRLFQDEKEIEQSKEKGKPFLITNEDKTTTKITPKRQVFGGQYPRLEVNGIIHDIAKQMKWYDRVILYLPIISIVFGGLLGALFGGIAIAINSYIMSRELKPVLKYSAVIGVSILALVLYFITLGSILYFITPV